MTDTPSADDLVRENAELRKRNGELEDGLRTVVRRQAAAEVGLDPDMARWIRGDTIEDAAADAKRLADRLAPANPWAPSSASPEADAIQEHLRERRDAAGALNNNPNPQEG